MATITTIPSPVIANQDATLYYTNNFPIPVPGSTYVLQLSGSSVSSTYTGVSPTKNIISNNVINNGATTSSACLYYNGNIYTTMTNSDISGNGYIQKTDLSGNSTVYLQFNNGSSPPVPSNYPSPQFPTGLAIDSNGILYFLVFGDNNVYKISDLNTPSNYIKYNTTSSAISAPFDLTINLNNNYMYVTATNPSSGSYYIEQIDASGVTSRITNYTFNKASYGICWASVSNSLFIGYSSGVIGKYDLNTSTFTSNFYTISGEGIVYGLTYIAISDTLIANVGNQGNIYSIPITETQNSKLIISNSGILGSFGSNEGNIIYGTSSSQIISYTFNQTFTFNNLLLSQPSNLLSLYNQTTSQIIDTFTINTNINTFNPQTFYKVGGIDLSNIFQPLSLGTQSSVVTKYTVSGYGDLNQIFAAYTSGDKAITTNYNVPGYGDLNNIFLKYNQNVNFIATGNYTITSDGSYNTIIRFTGNGTITFNIATTINYIAVGGGGGGGDGHLIGGVGGEASCGGGGGGGAVVTGTTTTVVSQTETIVIGNGGTHNTNTAQNTTISGSYLNITSSAGTGSTGNNGSGGGGKGAVIQAYYIQSNATNGSIGLNTYFGYFGGSGGGGGGYDYNNDNALPGGGGSGGGGNGGNDAIGNNGTANTGGAGGGGGISPYGPSSSSGGNGGSGVAIIYFNI